MIFSFVNLIFSWIINGFDEEYFNNEFKLDIFCLYLIKFIFEIDCFENLNKLFMVYLLF